MPIAGVDSIGTAGSEGEVLGLTGVDRRSEGPDRLALLTMGKKSAARVLLYTMPDEPGDSLGDPLERSVNATRADTFSGFAGIKLRLN